MDAPAWLSQRLDDVPAGDAWLGPHERRVLAGLHLDRRRSDWRLGRWTAKAALSRRFRIAGERFEILAAADGAPEAWLDGERRGWSLSISHRGGRALASVAAPPSIVGCDLELIEPRSDAFIRQWLAPQERQVVLSSPRSERARLANLMWAAKEAAAKVRRDGLRLDVRRAVVHAEMGRAADEWRRLRVEWVGAERATEGWWRADSGWVMVVASEPAAAAPETPPMALVSSRGGRPGGGPR